MTFDTTIHLGDLIAYGTVIIAFVKLYIGQRDEQRDLRRLVGRDDPLPVTGMVARVDELREDVDEHREWLVFAGLDRRQGDRRGEAPRPR